jgi:hypothetical protein
LVEIAGLARPAPLWRGFLEGFAVVFFISICLFPVVDRVAPHPRTELLNGLAQVGATLLVAYAVETSWFVKVSHARGGDRENWVGFAAALGVSGVLGIGSALALSGHGDGSRSWIEEFGFGWSVSSLGLLGLLVGLLPLFLYEWSHSVRNE